MVHEPDQSVPVFVSTGLLREEACVIMSPHAHGLLIPT